MRDRFVARNLDAPLEASTSLEISGCGGAQGSDNAALILLAQLHALDQPIEGVAKQAWICFSITEIIEPQLRPTLRHPLFEIGRPA